MKKCAYCGREGKMTREHVIPNGFIKSMNTGEQTIWLNKAPTRVIEAEIKVKDVCNKCNNETLSELDDYALGLIKKFNSQIDVNTSKISFKSDYNKLTRWLLKVCFNSARANDAESDIDIYKIYTDYILGQSQSSHKLKFYVGFLELNHPNVEEDEWYHLQNNQDYQIDSFRICLLRLKNIYMYNCAARTLIINSFAFLTLAFNENATESEIQNIENEILDSFPNFEPISLGKKLYLKKGKNFWWQSIATPARLHDKYLQKRDVSQKIFSEKYNLYIVTITREEIISLDFYQINGLKNTVTETRDSVMNYYQKVEILVDGYNEEKRQLFQIEEVQQYMSLLLKRFTEIIWFINLEIPIGCFSLLVSSFVNINKITDINDNSTMISVNQEKLTEFIMICFSGINKLINENALDNEYNKVISSNLFHAIQQRFGIQLENN